MIQARISPILEVTRESGSYSSARAFGARRSTTAGKGANGADQPTLTLARPRRLRLLRDQGRCLFLKQPIPTTRAGFGRIGPVHPLVKWLSPPRTHPTIQSQPPKYPTRHSTTGA